MNFGRLRRSDSTSADASAGNGGDLWSSDREYDALDALLGGGEALALGKRHHLAETRADAQDARRESLTRAALARKAATVSGGLDPIAGRSTRRP
jgi:hypothetical protein